MRTLAVILIFLTGVALAQGPPAMAQGRPAFFPWWESPSADKIDLSEEQQEQIQAVQRKYRDLMIDQRATMEKAEARLADLFNEVEIDTTVAKEIVDQLVDARGQVTRSLTQMSVELRQVLTAEQWKTLQKLRSERLPWFRDPSRFRNRRMPQP